MPYRIAGNFVSACSCELICPCAVDGKPTDPQGNGQCRGVLVFHIADGNLDQVRLDGVDFALFVFIPSNPSAGGWKAGLVVDEGAGEEQAAAVERIASGREGGTLGDLAQFIDEYLGMRRASVSLSDGDAPSARVGDTSEFRVEPLRGPEGEPTSIKNALFGFAPEYYIGRGAGRSSEFGIEFDAAYGEHAPFEFAS